MRTVQLEIPQFLAYQLTLFDPGGGQIIPTILLLVPFPWNASVWLFLIFILFFKAREQIENENGQQLDSEKKAMDLEDENLLATVANKILGSSK